MRKYLFLYWLVLACQGKSPVENSKSNAMVSSSMQVSVIRLRPMEDLKKSLENFVKENQIEAGIVLTCVGSLQASHLRLANQPQGTTFEGKKEIVSLVGTLALSGSHLHLSISDSTGKTVGGHLLEGCLVYTTAEIAIGILPRLRFTRELDTISSYKELKVYPK